MKPGDKAMLVRTQGWSSRLWIKECRVRAVHKTGHILIEGSDQKYRADGWPTGKSSYSRSEQLRPWDDALWQQFQMEQANAKLASNLLRLSQVLDKASRDHERAAAIWESLPFEVRALIEKDAQGGVTPVRVTLSRAKGWRMPPNTVKVDRSTRWGNPFVVGSRFRASESDPWCIIFSAEQAVEMFRSFCDHQIGWQFRADIVTHLRGKNLACWCKPGKPCHADVLLALANEAAP